jgi:regulator of cell morphogenesis and NO signaling
MNEERNSITVGEIVANNFRASEIFKKYKIDFCCGGNKSLKDVCIENALDFSSILREIESCEPGVVSEKNNFNEWEPAVLADYIVNTHHYYVHSTMPEILDYTQKIAKVHGKVHPETIEIADLFILIMEDMISHMEKEEKILFPFVKKLSNAKLTGVLPQSLFGAVTNPVRMMVQEHEAVGDIIKRIITLSNNFIPPVDACNTFKIAYAKLKEFTDDLFQHMHLENNILFPKVLELENTLSAKYKP